MKGAGIGGVGVEVGNGMLPVSHVNVTVSPKSIEGMVGGHKLGLALSTVGRMHFRAEKNVIIKKTGNMQSLLVL